MKKNILLAISGCEENKILTGFLEMLAEKNYNFHFISGRGPWRNFAKYKGWSVLPFFGTFRRQRFLNVIIFLLLVPFLFFWHFFLAVYYYKKYKIKSVLCLAWPEKIIYSFLARILPLQAVWIENPGEDYQDRPPLLKRLLKKSSPKARAIVFLPDSEMKLRRLGFSGEVVVIAPGVKPAAIGQQENIFSSLAKNRESYLGRKKYFTLGAVTDFSHPHQLENLFRAANICLNVIPNLQIVIIGEGEERKQAMWNSKKMGLENLTWFVGWQEKLKKWLDSLDVYISVSEKSTPTNLKLVLKAMSVGLPVVIFSGEGQEDLITNDKTGLVCAPGDYENLAQLILKLFKNKVWRQKIGEEAQLAVVNNFSADKQAEIFGAVIEAWEQALKKSK